MQKSYKGRRIKSREVERYFDEGRIVGIHHANYGGKYWRIRCSAPKCAKTFLHHSGSSGRCRSHSKGRLFLGGRYTNIVVPKKFQGDVKWIPCHNRRGDTHYVLHVRCEISGCTFYTKYRSEKELQRCKNCHFNSQRLRPYEWLYNSMKVRCAWRNKTRSKKIFVRMTYAEFADFCRKNTRCVYCGKTVTRQPFSSLGYGNPLRRHGSYIDRKNNDKSYTLDNIVTACATDNVSKGSFIGYEEMLIIGAARAGDLKSATIRLKRYMADVAEKAIALDKRLERKFQRLSTARGAALAMD